MSESEVVPFSEMESSEVDLNLAVKQGQKMTDILKKWVSKKRLLIVVHITNTIKKIIRPQLLVMVLQQNKHTTTVVFRNEGSTKEQALKELSFDSVTQKTLGAFSGIYQQQVSQLLLENEED